MVSVCMSVLMTQVAVSQELEPRRWSHLPVGANFATAGYVYTDADIFFDPALQIEWPLPIRVISNKDAALPTYSAWKECA